MTKKRSPDRLLSFLIHLFSLFLTFSIVLSLLIHSFYGPMKVLVYPGYFLWKSFSFLAFYVPLYPLVMWYAYRRKALSAAFLLNWNYSLLFFFTLSAFVRLLIRGIELSALSIVLTSVFGYIGSLLLLLLFLFVEGLFLYQLNYYFFRSPQTKSLSQESPQKEQDHQEKTSFRFVYSSLQRDVSFQSAPFDEQTSQDSRDVSAKKDSQEDSREEKDELDREEEFEKEDHIPRETVILPLWARYGDSEHEQLVEDLDKDLIEAEKLENLGNGNQESIVLSLSSSDESSSQEPSSFKDPQDFSQVQQSLDLSASTEFSSQHSVLDEFSFSEEDSSVKDESDERHLQQSSYIYPQDFFEFSVQEEDQKAQLIPGPYEKEQAALLMRTLEEFRVEAELIAIVKGPVVTLYELLPARGVKISRITSLSDNIALALAAPSLRIVAPIPGKSAVGIEIPNQKRQTVYFGDLIVSPEYKHHDAALSLILGRTMFGQTALLDLAKAPHLLIAGATGAGKSVCLNTLIVSLLYRYGPADLRFLMVDPKVVELKFFNDIPHLLTPVITDSAQAMEALQWCTKEMERRYTLLNTLSVRDLRSYNEKIMQAQLRLEKMPYLVVIIDEFADLMVTRGKEIEASIARLAAMSRAVGIHLVLATQRPSVNVITGLIKANFPTRIAFMVSSKIDSRIILDRLGAEQLLGRGDMLFSAPWNMDAERIQGSFLSEGELLDFIDAVRVTGKPRYINEEIFKPKENEGSSDELSSDRQDPLYAEAVELVLRERKASISYVQRRLRIGYNRAARFIELMEEEGLVGPSTSSGKPREIYD